VAQGCVCIVYNKPNYAKLTGVSDRKSTYVDSVFRKDFRRACKSAGLVLCEQRDLFQYFVLDHSHHDFEC